MPATFNGWDVITMPDDPPAPASIEFAKVDIVAVSRSPFTGQQQVQNWQAGFMEANVSMPPLTDAQAPEWVQFLLDLKGMANVFQFNASFTAAYPLSLTDSGNPRYWRLKSNLRKWSISESRLYGMQFELLEAL